MSHHDQEILKNVTWIRPTGMRHRAALYTDERLKVDGFVSSTDELHGLKSFLETVSSSVSMPGGTSRFLLCSQDSASDRCFSLINLPHIVLAYKPF